MSERVQNCRDAMDWFSERLSQQYLALEKADIAAASIAQQRTNIRKVRERLRAEHMQPATDPDFEHVVGIFLSSFSHPFAVPPSPSFPSFHHVCACVRVFVVCAFPASS